jgi:hypothetical protein
VSDTSKTLAQKSVPKGQKMAQKNVTDLRKAAEQALDVLRNTAGHSNQSQARIDDAKHALVQALAMERFSEVNQEIEEALKQPEQEPVAWMWKDGSLTSDPDEADGTWTKLYTAPPNRDWNGLTQEECEDLCAKYHDDKIVTVEKLLMVTDALLKEKNT